MTLSWSSFSKLSNKSFVRKVKSVKNSFKKFGNCEGKKVAMSIAWKGWTSTKRVCRLGSMRMSTGCLWELVLGKAARVGGGRENKSEDHLTETVKHPSIFRIWRTGYFSVQNCHWEAGTQWEVAFPSQMGTCDQFLPMGWSGYGESLWANVRSEYASSTVLLPDSNWMQRTSQPLEMAALSRAGFSHLEMGSWVATWRKASHSQGNPHESVVWGRNKDCLKSLKYGSLFFLATSLALTQPAYYMCPDLILLDSCRLPKSSTPTRLTH